MDRIDTMKVFTRVYERRSFSAAAEDLNLPASTVSDVIKKLEAKIGVVLLERTTRQVTPTIDGDAFYHRCLSIIQDVEDAETFLSGAKPKGALRVDVHGTLARHFLMPKLPDFLANYPEIDLFLSEGDRIADVIREGIDCVLRVGNIQPQELVAKQIATLEEVTVASPQYIQKFGLPSDYQALEKHQMVGFRATGSSTPMPLEFCIGGNTHTLSINTSLTVNSAETLVMAACNGLGIVQVPRYHVAQDISEGRLIPMLEDCPPAPSPVSVLYPRNRKYASRVKAFVDWLGDVF
ncbi:LysR family transcriptional regulator [Vibrio quintilis]|uniref:HTH-type transcriptional regulator DmlR n=1 Tax=Vibrio quintilis TaxID=1117707 RepID=A0A1M7YYI5_9VIBR|nr:LysR family transcriptional regulator [Vibrio quintilis]SHO57655.1 HTH-type transcriptional regulator DmlR [Vibrio quintilis]